MVNYYEVLEVSENASKEVIEKAYKALAKKYHPDLNQENRKEAELKMKEINEAFEILMDDHKRETFNRVLERKKQIEFRKQASNQKHFNNSQASSATNLSSNGYYTDKEGNFYINTTNMDEKTKKKLQDKMQERYLEAYDSYLRERGYKLKYRWTFKKILQLVLVILIAIAVCVILFFIPPIHEWCLDLYEENIAVKIIVDLVASIFRAIGSIFGG